MPFEQFRMRLVDMVDNLLDVLDEYPDYVFHLDAQGDHVDPWGCVWSNVAHGMESIVTVHPVPTRADVHTLKAPTERTGFPHGFMYLRLCDRIVHFGDDLGMQSGLAMGPVRWRHQRDHPRPDRMRECARILRRVAPRAEQKNVNLNVELLNSKVDHPDYRCDRSDRGYTLCDMVGSPRRRRPS